MGQGKGQGDEASGETSSLNKDQSFGEAGELLRRAIRTSQ